jgi:hypothetical protein
MRQACRSAIESGEPCVIVYPKAMALPEGFN